MANDAEGVPDHTGDKNSGLQLALPITLGIFLFIVIIVVVVITVMSLVTCREKFCQQFGKLTQRKKTTPDTKESSPHGKCSQNGEGQSRKRPLRLFPTKEHPSTFECGIFQAGDIYYEESSIHQAGKKSREAKDLVGGRTQSFSEINPNKTSGVESVDFTNTQDQSQQIESIYDNSNFVNTLRMPPINNNNINNKKKRQTIASVEDALRARNIQRSSTEQREFSTLNRNDQRKTFVAMYALPSSSRDELNLLANDVIYYLGEENNGWLKGQKKETGDIGWFPKSYVREGVSQAPDTAMFESEKNEAGPDDNFDNEFDEDESSGLECIVKHDYRASNEGDITLRACDVVLVSETLENGWWKGECNGRIGYFPGSYVEVVENSKLITHSCLDLSKVDDDVEMRKQRKSTSNQRKIMTLSHQFRQKLSLLNPKVLSITTKKLRKDPTTALHRKPAPQIEKTESSTNSLMRMKKLAISSPIDVASPTSERNKEQDDDPLEPLDDDVYSTLDLQAPSSSVAERQSPSCLNEEISEIYGNLQEFSSSAANTLNSTLPKPAVPRKPKRMESINSNNRMTLATTFHLLPRDPSDNTNLRASVEVPGVRKSFQGQFNRPPHSDTLNKTKPPRKQPIKDVDISSGGNEVATNFDDELKKRLTRRAQAS